MMKKSFKQNRGITLVELLVVISILGVLTAVMLPRLRMVNKDRNLRETARVVGSMLARASQNAVNDGTAGVIIERNDNFQDANGRLYGASTMYLMRKLPDYTGDLLPGQDLAEVKLNYVQTPDLVPNPETFYQVDIPKPLDQANGVVRLNDFISFNYSSVKYRIVGFTGLGEPDEIFDQNRNLNPVPPQVDDPPLPGELRLQLSRGLGGSQILPPLRVGSRLPFVIHRRPRKLASSRVDLPNGFLVDMRYSGPINLANTSTIFDVDVYQADDSFKKTVEIVFNSKGAVDRFYSYNGMTIDSAIPVSPLNFFISEYETDPLPNNGVLESPTNLWVTLNNSTGATNVADNTVPTVGNTLGERINYARGIAQGFQSSSQ